MPPNRAEKKQQITGQRRGQIREAALNVFSRLGYDGANITHIAREAGVSVGTIYNYYPSKRDLLVAITDSYIIEPFRNVVQPPHPAGDLDYIAAIMENRLNLDASRFLALFSEIQRDPELRHKYAEQALKPILGVVERYIAARIAEGVFRDVNPALVARAVAGMVIGFILLSRMEGETNLVNTGDRQALARVMAGIILQGVYKTRQA